MDSTAPDNNLESQASRDGDKADSKSESSIVSQPAILARVCPHTTIVLAPGFLFPGYYAKADCFDIVSNSLRKEGFVTYTYAVGEDTGLNPDNIYANIRGIQKTIQDLVDDDDDVFLVLHCAAGAFGSAALKGLAKKERHQKGLKGGVVGIVYLTAGFLPKETDWLELSPGYAESPSEDWQEFFNRLEGDRLQFWRCYAHGKPPSKEWHNPIAYSPWKDVHTTYLVCQHDDLIPVEIQVARFATLASSDIKFCGAGHMPMLTMPDKVVEVVKEAVDRAWYDADKSDTVLGWQSGKD
ncbi:MAG: hypothetical protein MMC33_008541 [Icmadophila ericetorum]|nr:hypothetical protein [Icmadophila ericetorum]